ncbi:methyl-accepting chemotaxis protein [Argonema galeatum]|uniref:methyl-accepting chemotaxis protein n=1 Tax=Argonema galeatum TaxID=2942762 RepID=UPI002011CB09|nr:methyl-accepting chemotaxis protein [Argonema galeatum]MCL1467160.1 methyl-accepting chemotaxis protein [Argonema galeatum A003/A1]
MFQNLSLRAKAIGFAIALGTLPVLGIGAVAYYFANRSITQDVMQFQQAYAVELADKLSRFMFERYGDIQTIANLPMFANQRASSIISENEKRYTLNRYLDTYQVYDHIAVFDLSGNLIVKSRGEGVENYRDGDYFQQVLKTKRPFISKPEFSNSSNDWVIYLAAPVKDRATGKIIGVVRSRLPIKYIRERIKSLGNIEQQSHVVDVSGKFFVTRDLKEIGQEVQLEYPFFRQLQAAKQVDVRVVYSQTDKIYKVLASAPTPELEGMPNLRWIVLVDNDTAVAFKTQRELLVTLLMGTGATALVVSAIAAVIADRTTKSINVIVNAITTSTTEIAATVEQQERVATQQASSVNQTTTTITELGASSKASAEQAESSAENARQLLKVAESSAAGAHQVLNLAQQGTQTVDSTKSGMSALKEKVGEIAHQTMHLKEQTNQIGIITNIVSDLATQTHMLALNAAVEAVRAGEYGKGFGVVAAEIRKLADQSKQSAQKINALVVAIQSAIDSTVMVTDEGRKTAEEGIKLSQQTAEAFTNVTVAIENVVLSNQQTSLAAIDDIVVGSQQISLTAQQQAIATQQVVDAMNSLNQGAVQTATGITQTKIGIQKLNEAAQNLKAIV